jgi:hypothetical protein
MGLCHFRCEVHVVHFTCRRMTTLFEDLISTA